MIEAALVGCLDVNYLGQVSQRLGYLAEATRGRGAVSSREDLSAVEATLKSALHGSVEGQFADRRGGALNYDAGLLIPLQRDFAPRERYGTFAAA